MLYASNRFWVTVGRHTVLRIIRPNGFPCTHEWLFNAGAFSYWFWGKKVWPREANASRFARLINVAKTAECQLTSPAHLATKIRCFVTTIYGIAVICKYPSNHSPLYHSITVVFSVMSSHGNRHPRICVITIRVFVKLSVCVVYL